MNGFLSESGTDNLIHVEPSASLCVWAFVCLIKTQQKAITE